MATFLAQPPASHSSQQQTMQCMEIRGGNAPLDTAVNMPGIDAWVYSKPFRESAESGEDAHGGGDVYYLSSCATGRVTRLLVADVSGHGAGVCDLAGDLRGLMRRYVNYIDQTEFVRSMNRQFVKVSASGCFATALVTTFFAPTGTLTICNAGHPPPLRYRARTRTWDYLELRDDPRKQEESRDDDDDASRTFSNIPLGVLSVTEYEQFDVTLDPGDLVLCYTDSLPEARTNAAVDGMLGLAGVLRIVRGLGDPDAGAFIPKLLGEIGALSSGNLDADDVTLLLFRPTSARTRTPLRDRLLAPVRVVRGVLASLRPGGGPAPIPEFTVTNIGGSLFDFLNRKRKRGPRRT
jgi:hypothetical protein